MCECAFTMNDGVNGGQKVLGVCERTRLIPTYDVRTYGAIIIITDVSNWLISSLYPAALKYQILGFCNANDAISTY